MKNEVFIENICIVDNDVNAVDSLLAAIGENSDNLIPEIYQFHKERNILNPNIQLRQDDIIVNRLSGEAEIIVDKYEFRKTFTGVESHKLWGKNSIQIEQYLMSNLLKEIKTFKIKL